MKKNIGTADKVIRLALVIVYLLAYNYGWVGGTTAIVLGFFAAIFFVTSLVNFCPLYSLLGVNTCAR